MFKLVVGTLLLAAVLAENIEELTTTTTTTTLAPESGGERSGIIEGGTPDDRYVPVPQPPLPPGGPAPFPFVSMVRRIERIEDLLERMYATIRFQCGLHPQQAGYGYPPPPPYGLRGNGNEIPQPGKPNPAFPENGAYNNPQYQPYGAWGPQYAKAGQPFPTRAKRSEVMNAEMPIVDEEIKPDLHIIEEPKEEFTTLPPEIEHELPTTEFITTEFTTTFPIEETTFEEFTTTLPIEKTTFEEFTTTFPIEETTFEEPTTTFPVGLFGPEQDADEQLTTMLSAEHFTEEFMTTTLPADHFNAAEPVVTDEIIKPTEPELTTLAAIIETSTPIEHIETTTLENSSSEEEEEEEEAAPVQRSRKKRGTVSSESEEETETTVAPIIETTNAPIAPEAIEHSVSPIEIPPAVNIITPIADSAVLIPEASTPVNAELPKEDEDSSEESSEEIEITTTEAPIEEKPLVVPAAVPMEPIETPVVETPMETPVAVEMPVETPTAVEMPMETPTAPEMPMETPMMTPEAMEGPMETAPVVHETAPAMPVETPTAVEPAAPAHPVADEAIWTTELPISNEWTTTMEMITEELQHAEPVAPETHTRRKRDEAAVVADEMHIEVETTFAPTTFAPTTFLPEAPIINNDAMPAPAVEAAPMPVETPMAVEPAPMPVETPTAAETPLIAEDANTFPTTTEQALMFTETFPTTAEPAAPEFAETTFAAEFTETTFATEFAETTFAPTEAAPIGTSHIETAPAAPAVEMPMTNDVPAAAPIADAITTLMPEVEIHETTFAPIIKPEFTTTFAPTIEAEFTTTTEAFHRKKRDEEAVVMEELTTPAPILAPAIKEEEHTPEPAMEVHPTEAMEIIEDKSTPAIEILPTEKMEIIEEELLTTTPLPLIPEETEIHDLPADDEPHKPAAPLEIPHETTKIDTEKSAPAVEVVPVPKEEEPVTEEMLASTTALPPAEESSEEEDEDTTTPVIEVQPEMKKLDSSSSEEEIEEPSELDTAMEAEATLPARRRFRRLAH